MSQTRLIVISLLTIITLVCPSANAKVRSAPDKLGVVYSEPETLEVRHRG